LTASRFGICFRFLSILLPLWLVLATVPLPVHAASVDLSLLDRFIKTQAAKGGLPGLQVAIVRGDRTVHLGGYGDKSPGAPMTTDTPIILGSLSKTITAVAVLQLKDQGRIDLDAPIRTYLPWFNLADEQAAERMTVRHALHHQTGLSWDKGIRIFTEGTPLPTAEAIVRDLRNFTPVAPPGSRFEYSNLNYMILGLIVEVVSGQSYEQYVREHILNPLGMNKTHFSLEEALQNGLAAGYRNWFGLSFPTDTPDWYSAGVTCGYLLSSAEDLSRFLNFQINEGRFEGKQVLSRESVRDMQTGVVPMDSEEGLYGMGWKSISFHGRQLLFHDGHTNQYMTQMYIDPATKTGIVLLTNIANSFLTFDTLAGLTEGILDLLDEKEARFKASHYWLTYSLFDILVLLNVWLWFTLFRRLPAWRTRARLGQLSMARRLWLPLFQIAFAVAYYTIIPRVQPISWASLYSAQPDLIFVWLANLLLLILHALCKLSPSLAATRAASC
jgi:CubicO group peptidase (beta-lactamase class C family)